MILVMTLLNKEIHCKDSMCSIVLNKILYQYNCCIIYLLVSFLRALILFTGFIKKHISISYNDIFHRTRIQSQMYNMKFV